MNLVIQGLDVATPDLKHLAKLTGASAIEAITPAAFRLRDAQAHAEVAAYCETAALDFAWVPEDRLLSGFGLVVMDMDSTLIAIECIDELADFHGLKSEVAAITAASMRGEIEFGEGLRRRAALLEGTDASALARVYEERLKLSSGADVMLAGMRAAGIKTQLISGGFTYFTDRLRDRLGLDYSLANQLEIVDGKLSGRLINTEIVDAAAKRSEMIRVRDSLGLRKAQVIGIGDGANDLPFLAECGVSVAYHAKPIVHAQATHALNHVGLDGVLNLFG